MELKDQKVLVVGMATSGIPTVKTLHRLGAVIDINDLKTEAQLKEQLESIKSLVRNLILGKHPEAVEAYDLLVLSPGVPTTLPFIEKARQAGVEVIGELELAYRLSQGRYIAITGTNGKTTTTALVGEIFKLSGRVTEVVGNIGIPVISKALESTDETCFVTEVSSFQLESVHAFTPHVAAILNITPDHLNRHKTMEDYIDAKMQVTSNQTGEDFLILNYDNPGTRKLGEGQKAEVVYFSRLSNQPDFVCVSEDWIVVRDGEASTPVCPVDEIFIQGSHNLENALAATAIAYYAGIEPEIIREGLRVFKGVAHRFELVDEVAGIRFYNDSKGTNPDASIKAIESIQGPTVLIAGGMDKGSEFETFIQAFGDKIKHLVLIGETAEMIQKTAFAYGFKNVTITDVMENAVRIAFQQAIEGGNVLLSPACASWDMYPSYEVRGNHFKKCVTDLSNNQRR